MEQIFYSQNTSATEQNTIVVDNTIYSDFQSKVPFEALQFICKKDELKSNKVKAINNLKEYGKIKSKNFKLIQDEDGIFVKGCFIEKDDDNRNMPYIFWMKTTNIETFQESLTKITRQLNRTCLDNVLEIYNVIFTKKRNTIIKFSLTFCFILLILFFIIWTTQVN